MTRPVPGPNRHPRKPLLQAPPHACDCHAHVFGPLQRFPFVPEREYTPPESTLPQYVALLEHLGVERGVIVQPSIYGTDNSATEDGIRHLGARGRGVAVLNPGVDEAELARLHVSGFRGLRFNLVQTGGSTSLDALETLAVKAAPLGWHLQIYLRGRMLPEVAQRLRALPTDIVIDHLGHFEACQGTGQPGFRSLLRLLDGGRCWVKLCPYRFDDSGFPYARARPFARALGAVAPDRLLWGSDWPHADVPGPMPDDGELLDALGDWFEDRATIDRILADNPARLYGFER